MSKTLEITRDVSAIARGDIDTAKGAQDLVIEIGAAMEVADNDKTTLLYKLGPTAVVAMSGGMTQTALASVAGRKVTQGALSKPTRIARLAAVATDPERAAEMTDEQHEEWQNLVDYYLYATNGEDVRTLGSIMEDWISPEGTVSAPAIRELYSVFGATEYLYKVAKGNRLHEDDPRNGEDDGDDEDGDDDDGRDPADVALDMLRNALQQCTSAGVEATTVACVVSAHFG